MRVWRVDSQLEPMLVFAHGLQARVPFRFLGVQAFGWAGVGSWGSDGNVSTKGLRGKDACKREGGQKEAGSAKKRCGCYVWVEIVDPFGMTLRQPTEGQPVLKSDQRKPQAQIPWANLCSIWGSRIQVSRCNMRVPLLRLPLLLLKGSQQENPPFSMATFPILSRDPSFQETIKHAGKQLVFEKNDF